MEAYHLDELRASGLSDATIQADGYFSVTAAESARLIWWDVGSGWAIRYPAFAGKPAMVRVKPDTPVTIDGRIAKYLSPKHAGNRLFIPAKTRAVLTDPRVPLCRFRPCNPLVAASLSTRQIDLCAGVLEALGNRLCLLRC